MCLNVEQHDYTNSSDICSLHALDQVHTLLSGNVIVAFNLKNI